MSIFNQLLMVEDPRINRCKKFPLGYILTTVFTATLSGCSSWYEIEDYAEEYKVDLEALYERISGDCCTYYLSDLLYISLIISIFVSCLKAF